MSQLSHALNSAAVPASDRLPAWSWLWLPLVVAVILLVLGHAAPDFYAVWIGSESRGILELSHVLLPLAGLVVALRTVTLPVLRGQPWLYAWIGFAALACLYIAGEEASWGQHYFGWVTPESWQALNDQGETNLHNTSSWLDQKPRSLLELGVIVGGIIVPIVALWRPKIRQTWFGVVLPPLICLPVAVLAEFARMTERLLKALTDGAYLFNRASEVQELYFFYFILLYLIVLRRRLKQA
ncbi:MAG: hypothetical protein AAF495_18605 [Pseudomonadota bacterium]